MRNILDFLEILKNESLTKEILVSNLERLADNFPLDKRECKTTVLSEVENKLRPIFLKSPCMKYAFEKPNGYAGDYFSMYLIHNNCPQGEGLGLLLDDIFLSSLTCESVRNYNRQIRPTATYGKNKCS